MKAKVVLITLVVFFLSAVVCSAQSRHMGTWKLNEAKSHFHKGASKNNTVVYEAAGDQVKVTVDGVDGSGAATHNEWTGKFDGKYYALTGSPTGDVRSYTKVNSRTLSIHEKKDGKVVLTGTITVATNGKSRTVRATAKNAQGKWTTNTAVYDKQ
jgi:FlaG/FlaF family flagellin (archaellin)